MIVGLLIACIVVPAYASERQSQDFPKTFTDHKVTVVFDKVNESDTSDVYSPQNYPPTQYKFVTLYYSFYNPTSSDIRYEFKVDIRDHNGNVFSGVNNIIAENVPANSNLHRYKEFAIYRNSTDYYFVWTDKQSDSPWLPWITPLNITYPEPTPEPTTVPSVTSQPTTTPTQTPITQRCLPFLPLGMVIGGFGGMGLLSRNFMKSRR